MKIDSRLLRNILLPKTNRFIYWLFFCLAFPINFSEGVDWYGWIINPVLWGWFAVGLKMILVVQSPLEYRFRVGKGIDILVGIFVCFVLFQLILS